MSVLFVGDVAPEQLALDLVPDQGIDLSTVTAATLNVKKPDGTETTWTVTRSNQTPTTLTLTHVFAAVTSELDQSGTWRLYALLTLPGGTIRTETADLPVKARYSL